MGRFCCFAPGPSRIGRLRPGCCSVRLTRCRSFVPRTFSVLPSSQGTPMCLCPALRPRPDQRTPRHCGVSVLPPLTKRRRLRRLISFEAQLHGFSTRCLRFMPPSLATMQNSLPGVASLSGWDFSLPTEFHWRVSLSLPLSQGLPWRDLPPSFCHYFEMCGSLRF